MPDSTRLLQLAGAIGAEQVINRTLSAVLITTEVKRKRPANRIAALRKIIEEWHRAIDIYGTTTKNVPEIQMEIDKERARQNVDAVGSMVKELLNL
jgi:hypothetical protein